MEARKAWLLVTKSVLSWQYCGPGPEVTLWQHGRCWGAQQTALDRFYALADSFVEKEVSPCIKLSCNEDLRCLAAQYDVDMDVCLSGPLILEPNAAARPPYEVIAKCLRGGAERSCSAPLRPWATSPPQMETMVQHPTTWNSRATAPQEPERQLDRLLALEFGAAWPAHLAASNSRWSTWDFASGMARWGSRARIQ